MFSWIVRSSITWMDWYESVIAARSVDVGFWKLIVFRLVFRVSMEALTSSEEDDAFTCG